MAEVKASEWSGRMIEEIGKVFSGKTESMEDLILGLFAGLHVLIEDIPGVGKTTLARSLARCCRMDYGRIQFTPDLLPGDITGMSIWDPVKRDFVFKQGAVSHEFVLADEINRATARTQSALLEAMQESAITVDGKTLPLSPAFFVVATQNPHSFAGTFLLPEAQIDRFGLSLSLGYPNRTTEAAILDLSDRQTPYESICPVCSPDDILDIRRQVREVEATAEVRDYVLKIAEATRRHDALRLGLSPRGSQHLYRAAKARAVIQDRRYLIPEDVRGVAIQVLRHRLFLTPAAGYEKLTITRVIEEILDRLPIPAGV